MIKHRNEVHSSPGLAGKVRNILNLVLMICVFMSSSLFAINIYVDGDQAVNGNGTSGNPYNRISYAINSAHNHAEPNTILIKGRYNGQYYNQNLSISGFQYPLTIKRWATNEYELIIKGTGTTISTISIGPNTATIRIAGATISRASNPPAQSYLLGGGIRIYSSNPVIIEDCVIHNCRAWRGGGIHADQSSVQIVNSIMHNNTGVGDFTSLGGAIYGENSDITIEESILYDNARAISGQNILCEWSILMLGGFLDCNSSTIIDDYSGGIMVDGPAVPAAVFQNCIIREPYMFSMATYEFCLAYNTNMPGNFYGLGNKKEDPLFVDRPSGDFSLSKGSPCIGAGYSPDYWDFLGDQGNQDLITPHDETQDIGAIPFNGDRFITYSFDDDQQGNWMCFPVLDDFSYVTIGNNTYRADNMRAVFYDYEGTPSEMNRVEFKWYNPSNVFGINNHLPNNYIDWRLMYGQDSDEGFLGYKALFNSPSDMERIHGYHVPLDQYVHVPVHSEENWIGYFLPETQTPYAAFGSYLDELYYIQHKDWTMARTMPKRGAPWIVIGGTTTLSYGDMVIVKRFGPNGLNPGIYEFQWTRGFHIKKYVREIPEYFEFAKEPEYTAIFVQMDSLSTVKEIAIMSYDQCYGAAVVDGETVMIPAFISSLPEGSELELVAWDEAKSSPKSIAIKLFDQTNDNFIQCRSFVKDNSDHYLIKTGSTTQDTEVPPALSLGIKNYPNPFNPSTTINFSVPSDGDVNLTIYNAKGQLVNTLVSEHKIKGNHQVVWHGKDASGSSVASGLYFTRLVSGGKSISSKILLMK